MHGICNAITLTTTKVQERDSAKLGKGGGWRENLGNTLIGLRDDGERRPKKGKMVEINFFDEEWRKSKHNVSLTLLSPFPLASFYWSGVRT
jgi:hypothetical protein